MSDDPHPVSIYKVTSRALFDASLADGQFAGMPIDHQDGYVHFSTAGQLCDTLRLHFAGQDDLVLFAVDSAPLGEALRWEPSRGGQLFPHLYGALPMVSVTRHAAIAVLDDGQVSLPDWVQ